MVAPLRAAAKATSKIIPYDFLFTLGRTRPSVKFPVDNGPIRLGTELAAIHRDG